MKRFWLLLILSIFASQDLKAQDTLLMSPREDTLILKQDLPAPVKVQNIENRHSPKTATLLALIPSAGQAYNRKYWKMPIVYAGFGVTTYFAITNGNDYRLYRDAYDYKMEVKTDVSEKAKKEAARYTADNLITLRDYYRGNMELSWILTAAWYIVQIIDANVDAHFFYYDISDELTLHIEPQVNTIKEYTFGYGNNIGISLKLNF